MTDSQASSQLSNLQIGEGSSSSEYTDDDEQEFGDIHRLILQGIFSAGWMDAKGVKKLFQESCKYLKCDAPTGEHTSPPFIQKVVREINEKTKVFGMMIRSATCEVTGGKFYVLLITTEKQIMRVQTFFTKVELDLYQMIIRSVLRMHDNFLITMNECINMAAELDSRFSKVHAEDFVNKMISLQYFVKVYKDDKEFVITLGFRTIREFEAIFRQNYSDCFGTCALCKTILLNGLICPACPTVYHRSCVKRYIKTCKNCVGCKGKWKNEESLPMRTMKGNGGGQASSSSSSSTQKTSQASSSKSSSSDAKGQSKKALRVASSSEDKAEAEMPILEPMVNLENVGVETKQSSKSKRSKDAPMTMATPQPSSSTSLKKEKSKRKNVPVPTVERAICSSESD